MTCQHEAFFVNAMVNRIDNGPMRFNADISISCEQCGKKFRFLGLPMGLDMFGAAVSPDGTEGRFAIHPVGVVVPGMRDDEPAGFRVLNKSPMAERARAAKLRDQVLKTWNPPLKAGGESPADIAQTSTMVALAFVFGREFMGELSPNQAAAVDSGAGLMRDVLGE